MKHAAVAQASQAAAAAAQASASQKAAEAGEINSSSATNSTSPSPSVKAFEGVASSIKAPTAIVSFALASFSFMIILS